MKNKKLMFFDIDDTLTSEKTGKIPESAITAIREAQAAGHLMYVNTGRCIHTITPEVRAVGFDGFVCGCGSAVYDRDGKPVFEYPIPECKDEIVQAALRNHVDVLLEGKYAMAFIFAAVPRSSGADFHYRDYMEKGLKIMDYTDKDFDFDKFVAWVNDAEDMKRFREVSDKYFDCIDRGHTMGGHLFEFVPLGVSKGTGMEVVRKYHDIPLEDTAAFGDSANDLSMFDHVGCAVAMGNSNSAALRAKADVICGRASEDGLYDMIRKLTEE